MADKNGRECRMTNAAPFLAALDPTAQMLERLDEEALDVMRL